MISLFCTLWCIFEVFLTYWYDLVCYYSYGNEV
jgi:hypothetical protein